jgi:hypothetical protein
MALDLIIGLEGLLYPANLLNPALPLEKLCRVIGLGGVIVGIAPFLERIPIIGFIK